jgi:hypothetical protein
MHVPRPHPSTFCTPDLFLLTRLDKSRRLVSRSVKRQYEEHCRNSDISCRITYDSEGEDDVEAADGLAGGVRTLSGLR